MLYKIEILGLIYSMYLSHRFSHDNYSIKAALWHLETSQVPLLGPLFICCFCFIRIVLMLEVCARHGLMDIMWSP